MMKNETNKSLSREPEVKDDTKGYEVWNRHNESKGWIPYWRMFDWLEFKRYSMTRGEYNKKYNLG